MPPKWLNVVKFDFVHALRATSLDIKQYSHIVKRKYVYPINVLNDVQKKRNKLMS